MSDNKDNMNKITNDELGEVAGGANKTITDEVLAEVKPAYGVSIYNSEHLKYIIGQKVKDKDLDKVTANKASEACEKITNDELGEVVGGLDNRDCNASHDVPDYGVQIPNHLLFGDFKKMQEQLKELKKMIDSKGGKQNGENNR